MQPNPYPNEPDYSQPTETNPPVGPDQQGGQYVPPQYRYTTQPAQAPQGAGTNESQSLKYVIGKIIDFIRWAIVALELLFLLRFVLELIGADPTNPFAQFLYNFTGFFLYPFLGIVPNTYLGTKHVAFIDWSTLIGMAVYGVLYLILSMFLRTTVSRPQEPL